MKKCAQLLNEAESILFYLSKLDSTQLPPDVLQALIDTALNKVQTSSERLDKKISQ